MCKLFFLQFADVSPLFFVRSGLAVKLIFEKRGKGIWVEGLQSGNDG